jgi:hypothetical protein
VKAQSLDTTTFRQAREPPPVTTMEYHSEKSALDGVSRISAETHRSVSNNGNGNRCHIAASAAALGECVMERKAESTTFGKETSSQGELRSWMISRFRGEPMPIFDVGKGGVLKGRIPRSISLLGVAVLGKDVISNTWTLLYSILLFCCANRSGKGKEEEECQRKPGARRTCPPGPMAARDATKTLSTQCSTGLIPREDMGTLPRRYVGCWPRHCPSLLHPSTVYRRKRDIDNNAAIERRAGSGRRRRERPRRRADGYTVPQLRRGKEASVVARPTLSGHGQ